MKIKKRTFFLIILFLATFVLAYILLNAYNAVADAYGFSFQSLL